ncbi:MFS transporter [Amycolatopsis silviterrae]|uniref:MFS transporter n=1 Tax=Amycolatopsis silviterrae TaxID=1656914 RepID=A0ABW5HLE9_9PSEU
MSGQGTGRKARLAGSLLPPPGPARMLAVAALVTSLGFGGYTAGSVLFFTRGAGLSTGQVGVGLSLAGLLAVGGNILFGRLADRWGPREITMVVGGLQVVALLLSTVVDSFAMFLPVVCLLGVSEQAGKVCRNALIGGAVDGDDLVRTLAYLRSVLNGGIAVGAMLASIAVRYDTRSAYQILLFAIAGVSLFGYSLYLFVPRTRPAPRLRKKKDFPKAPPSISYVFTGLLCGIVNLGDTVLTVGLPLWVIGQTAAPKPMAAWLHAVNTLLIVLLQVRASRGAKTITGATRLLRLAGWTMAAACPVFWLAHDFPAVWASIALLIGVLLLTASELWNSAAIWGLSFSLAPAEARGAYLGKFSIGTTLREVFGPVLVIGLITGTGGSGWFLLAGLMAFASACAGPVVRKAQRESGVSDGTLARGRSGSG